MPGLSLDQATVCGEQSEGVGGGRSLASDLGACALARESPVPQVVLTVHETPIFPRVLLSRNAVCLVWVLLAVALGAMLCRVLSNALFTAVSGKMF